MDATTKTANSVHRMKRAYTKKAVPVLEGADVAEVVEIIALPVVVDTGKTDAQNYAMRVWAGQSIDLPLAERKARVIAALEGQNLPIDVEFPL